MREKVWPTARESARIEFNRVAFKLHTAVSWAVQILLLWRSHSAIDLTFRCASASCWLSVEIQL